ncbi:MAG TPA: BlaI/MecI/CopY family transcriptional regulator [Kofleriaceae bacterium]|nr:BlaI/MecI/CopY family transcriptional regulator [Kofleriaceae bacterium]
MSKTPPDLTPAEFDLMKVLWQLERGTVAEVRAEQAHRSGSDLAYTTVMTLLGRLAAKGAVTVDRARQPFVYRPAIRRDSIVRERLKQFIDSVFDGKAESLVLHLVEDESLGRDELRRIQRRLGSDETEQGADQAEAEKPAAEKPAPEKPAPEKPADASRPSRRDRTR